MLRLDCCAPEFLKHELGSGRSDWNPLFTALAIQDLRVFEGLGNYPRAQVPIWSRPWVKALQCDGYPVEYRAYVRDGALLGISSYYPQRPLDLMPAHILAVQVGTTKLIRALQGREIVQPDLDVPTLAILAHQSGELEDPLGLHFTADWLVTQDDRVLFLEGGPPHERGAHMCCFKPGQIEGVALVDRNEQERESLDQVLIEMIERKDPDA